MLKVLAFYLFYWWFVKLENKKVLIFRAILAGISAIFLLVGSIVMFTEPHMVKDGIAYLGIFILIPALFFGLRVILDVRKILTKNPVTKSTVKTKNSTINKGEKNEEKKNLRPLINFKNFK